MGRKKKERNPSRIVYLDLHVLDLIIDMTIFEREEDVENFNRTVSVEINEILDSNFMIWEQ